MQFYAVAHTAPMGGGYWRKVMAEKGSQGVSYTNVSNDYFEKRGLERHAGLLALWGLGVAAVVSGDFSGWNFGIAEAGWGGLFIATILVIIMYYGMLFSIGEMAAALPHTGGAYSFARSSMGPWGGFVTGFAETIEYVATTGVIVFFSASYADSITNELFGLSMPVWIWWIILYAAFLLLNISGTAISFKFAIWVSFIALGVLAIFALMSIFSGKFSFDNLTNIAPEAGNSSFLPFGLWPIVAAMPFAMWFFLGIEELPLAAEEAHNPAKDIPKAGILGMGTLVITASLVLLLNPGITGAKELSESGEPLLDGFRAILPNSDVAALLAAFALVGLLASLQGIMFAYGRNIYSLSRAGYYPKVLSLTGSRKTPYTALIAGAVIGYGALLWAQYGGESAGAVVLNIAVITNVPRPRIPAFGISLAGSCASSAASGSSSIPRKNHIANGIAATIAQSPIGKKVEFPASGAILVRLLNENSPEKIAITVKMARTPRAINETQIANLNDKAAPEIFNSRKAA